MRLWHRSRCKVSCCMCPSSRHQNARWIIKFGLVSNVMKTSRSTKGRWKGSERNGPQKQGSTCLFHVVSVCRFLGSRSVTCHASENDCIPPFAAYTRVHTISVTLQLHIAERKLYIDGQLHVHTRRQQFGTVVAVAMTVATVWSIVFCFSFPLIRFLSRHAIALSLCVSLFLFSSLSVDTDRHCERLLRLPDSFRSHCGDPTSLVLQVS